jgi:hypothetical protein
MCWRKKRGLGVNVSLVPKLWTRAFLVQGLCGPAVHALVAAFAALFAVAIVYNRLEFTLARDDKWVAAQEAEKVSSLMQAINGLLEGEKGGGREGGRRERTARIHINDTRNDLAACLSSSSPSFLHASSTGKPVGYKCSHHSMRDCLLHTQATNCLCCRQYMGAHMKEGRGECRLLLAVRSFGAPQP